MDSVSLSWSPRNFVTIVTMGVLAYLGLGLLTQLWKNHEANQ